MRVAKAKDERRVGVRPKRSTVDLDMETNLPFTLVVLHKVYEDERAYSPVEDLDAFITPIKKPNTAEEHEVEEDEHSSHVDEDERVVIVEHEAEEDERERLSAVPPDLDEHSNREDEREGDLDENEDDREADAMK